MIGTLTDLPAGHVAMARLQGGLLGLYPGVPQVAVCRAEPEPYIVEVAYHLAAARRNFPEGVLYVLPCGVFGHGKGQLMCTFCGDDVFLGPDTGLMSLLPEMEAATTLAPPQPLQVAGMRTWTDSVCQLLEGVQTPAELKEHLLALGWTPHQPQDLHHLGEPLLRPYEIQCSIAHIDRFGNVVLQISRTQFEEHVGARPFRIYTGGKTARESLSDQYQEVGERESLCRFNAAGYLEIAVNGGHAAQKMNLDHLDQNDRYYKRVSIFLTDEPEPVRKS
jgi:S-adenosyl-L-methionine hydrolase (adenosine-forming)